MNGHIVACLDANYGKLQGASGQDLNHGHSHLIAFGGNNTGGPITVATCVNTSGKRFDFSSDTFVVYPYNQITSPNNKSNPQPGDLAPTLSKSNTFIGTDGQYVRRLTPLECERLQGFPDYYTAIPGASDTARYQAIGNSMAVPVMNWIGNRIDQVDKFLHHGQ